jgi:hypothetical protein
MVQVTDVFGFLADLPHADGRPQPVDRLNKRHAFIIDPFRSDIAGARVLDLAAHDGRWAWAFARAGAECVLGIEARRELVARFADYPDTPFKARVTLRTGDIFDALEAEVASGARHDVVGVLGIFYHIMDHFRLLRLIRRLEPRLVIIDSEFLLRSEPAIQLVRERTDNVVNATAQIPGQEVAVKGVPSFAALELMAGALDYRVAWADWGLLAPADRAGVRDYYRDRRLRRATCALRPNRAPG